MKQHLHHAGCGCLSTKSLSRRGVLGLGAATLAAFPALAASGHYESMVVNCIDPRFTTHTWAYMASQGYKDLYSHFVIGGGPIGVVSPKFADWHKAFWDNLDITIQLHNIRSVVGLTHRQCGAAAVAYGDRVKSDMAFETTNHVAALREFKAQIARRKPKLAVHTGIMALDGTVEAVS